jgi:tRNA nucleotidyltransferase (CCA-adding enzyme)
LPVSVNKKRLAGNEFFINLTPVLGWLLARAAEAAAHQQARVWLVGGVVRDLLLARPIIRDLDIAVEGDAVSLAFALADAHGGQVAAHHQAFGTATVQFAQLWVPGVPDTAGPVTLDLARTRTEHYSRPAALPVVAPAPIEQDLARRDFAINALALEVQAANGQPHGGRLLDPFAGRDDLDTGVLRVLHDHSFQDDPTRMLRGLRLAVRLGLHFEPHTLALLDAALADGMLEATTPERIRTELCLALEEPHPGAVLDRAQELGMLPHIFAPLQQVPPHRRAQASDPHLSPSLRMGLLTYEFGPPERNELIAHYRLSNEMARLLRDLGQLRQQLLDLRQPNLRNSQIDHLLRPSGLAALEVVQVAEGSDIGALIERYLRDLRNVAPLLDGHALKQMGIAPGPQMGALLAGLRAARLDGHVVTRADEEAWVRQQQRDSG